MLDCGYCCHCPEFSTIRVPNCSCPPLENVSPLLQIRWKRLVRDEGHNAATRGTGLNYFLKILSAERRWIVSGTPTTNLLGLNFGTLNDEDSETEELETSDSTLLPSVVCGPGDAALEQQPKGDNGISLGTGEEVSMPCTWSRIDREDLRKLGSMLSDFLGVLPFAAEPDSFSRLVVNGLMGEHGPLPGSTRVLEQVMSANMVRHRVADIEKYVRLPPLQEEVVLLDLEEYGQMTYNVLLSFVVVNAVDSERKDMVCSLITFSIRID